MTSAACMTATLLVSLLLWMPGNGQEVKQHQEEGEQQQQQQQCFPDAKDVRFDIQNFNIEIFREVSLITNSSLFISPYSIWSAFTLAYFGSEELTKKQLQTVLGVRGKKFVNNQWKSVRNSLEKPKQQSGAIFRSLNKGYFNTSITLKTCISQLINNIEEVNFGDKIAAADKINNEVSRTTEGLITNLIAPEALEETIFILLNAVYFKGKWENKFNAKDTEMRDFFDEHSSTKVLGKVEMMLRKETREKLVRYQPLGADIIAIPYDNSSISMILIKPTSSGNTVDDVLSQLTSNNIQDALNNMELRKVNLGLPKFRMETKIQEDLKNAMKALGVTEIFTRRANLTGFSNVPAKVDKVIHKAVVEVTEEGTKAAAATAILVVDRIASGPTPDWIMDKPFIYLIHDTTAEVTLFAGTYRHPNDAS